MVERNSGTCLDGLFFQYHGQPIRIVFGFREPSPAHLHAMGGSRSLIRIVFGFREPSPTRAPACMQWVAVGGD